jgi:rhodanese-related sulfurtransferase
MTCLVVIALLLQAGSPATAPATAPSTAPTTAPTAAPTTRPVADAGLLKSRCGIHCAYGALRAAGLNVQFVDLLQTKYLGSPAGSSFAELVAAIDDHGGRAVVLADLTTDALLEASDPMILHVRQDENSRTFDHFVLFLGMDGDNAKIVDAPKPLALVPLEQLQPRWSGSAILVLRGVRGVATPLARSRARVMATPVIGLVVLVGAWAGLRGLLNPVGSRRSGAAAAAMQFLVLLGLAIIAATVAHAAMPGGFYRNPGGTRTVQRTHIGDVIPSLDPAGARAMTRRGNAVVVDTRTPEAARRRPIEGARLVNASTPPQQRREILGPLPPDARLILFTDQPTDTIAELVARALARDGYNNLYLVRWTPGEDLP